MHALLQQVAPATQDSLIQADSLLADSLLADSAAVDTAAADTTGVLDRISEAISSPDQFTDIAWYQDLGLKLYEELINFFPRLIGALIIIVIFLLVYRVLIAVLSRVLDRSRRVAEGLRQFLLRTTKLILIAFGLISVLNQLGLDVTTLIAGLGIAGIALGFAAKDSLENMIAGLTILLDRPFEISDNIVIDGTFGTVTEITLRSTRIRTLDNEIAIIPNAQMINQKVINHTQMRVLRIRVAFGIAYKEYPQEARDVVLKLTKGDDRLHPSYPPQVVVTSMGASSVDMELRLWLRNPKQEIPIRLEYTERVREALREADIEIPFPHLQLFIDEAKGFEHLPPFNPPRPSS